MLLDTISTARFSWPLGCGALATPQTPDAGSAWRGMVSVMAAVDGLVDCSDVDSMLRRAVEVAREKIGLERVGLYLSDPSAPLVFRGTFGTGAHGETTDERGCQFEAEEADYAALRRIHGEQAGWLYSENASHIAPGPTGTVVIGNGWVVLTPLVAAGQLVGIMFNDTALSGTPMDETKQIHAAVYASLLAGSILSRQRGQVFREGEGEGRPSSTIQRIITALDHNPLTSGERLARELGISPGHLARSFKAEMGLSLVEYRNRLRIERFLRHIDHGGGNLLDAALQAGFGSYAQFHRVFRRFIGATPREYLTGHRERTSSIPPFAESAVGVG
jgi:AraC-like DNA-binding protein